LGSTDVIGLTVLKLGGELLEDDTSLDRAAASIVRMSAQTPLVVVHGGGRAIDAELRSRGLSPVFVDGLRVTNADTLDVAVSVLAGRANTALVAAVGTAGARAVGLTGADALIGLSVRAGAMRSISGVEVDLGLVGEPVGRDGILLEDLVGLGYVPVVCSIGVDRQGALLNVNADTFAGHLAAVLRARSLIVAGTTPGVLDAKGRHIPELSEDDIDSMAASGAAHSGMIAKLVACRRALAAGVDHVAIVTGRSDRGFREAPGTRLVARTGAAARVEQNV
jgi:acetylglutamate kinase